MMLDMDTIKKRTPKILNIILGIGFKKFSKI